VAVADPGAEVEALTGPEQAEGATPEPTWDTLRDMRQAFLLSLVAAGATACLALDPITDEEPGTVGDDSSAGEDEIVGPDPHGCAHNDKIAFSREEGCLNDGAVEFCKPSGDAELAEALFAIEPGLEVLAGSRGRVGCELATHDLVLFPTPGHDPSVCTGRHGELLPEAWDRLCAIAAFPHVDLIVPTWFE
jgi:hypothetical protein